MGTFSLAEHFLQATVAPPLRYVRRFVADRRYREFELLVGRYRQFPRFQEAKIALDGYDLLVPDVASLLSSWKEIFLGDIYACKFLSDRPRILDLGANVGVSVLYHKRCRPKAEVVAFEADPKIFGYLKRNLEINKIDGVTLVNKAAWDNDETLTFWSEGADGGRIGESASGGAQMQIPAVDIASVLEGQKFDFIKMDIEGAEVRVLPRCGDLLKHAQAAFVEYHSRAGAPQELAQIHRFLSDAGFRVYVTPVYCNPKPFDQVTVANGFDLQLNLFAIR
jgi:FkbM family methyltransferase